MGIYGSSKSMGPCWSRDRGYHTPAPLPAHIMEIITAPGGSRQPKESRMTISIQVSVNGNYKVPVTVKRGSAEPTTEVVSGRGHEGPKVLHIPYYHGSYGDVVVTVGQEEQDNG